jgi:hypothetical protein
MEQFNRTLGIIVGALIACGGTILALVAADVISPASVAPAGWFRDGLRELAALAGAAEVLATGISGALACGGFVLVGAEVAPVVGRPYMRGEPGTDREFAVQGRAVAEMVRFAGEQIEYVVAVEDASVAKDAQGLEVACKVVLEPYASAAPLAAIIEARIRNAVYTMTGLSVGHVHLRVRHTKGGPLVRAGR